MMKAALWTVGYVLGFLADAMLLSGSGIVLPSVARPILALGFASLPASAGFWFALITGFLHDVVTDRSGVSHVVEHAAVFFAVWACTKWVDLDEPLRWLMSVFVGLAVFPFAWFTGYFAGRVVFGMPILAPDIVGYSERFLGIELAFTFVWFTLLSWFTIRAFRIHRSQRLRTL